MRLRIAVDERVCAASVRRPPSVHRPLERERVEQRDRMHMAVTGKMAVLAVVHRDGRTDEARETRTPESRPAAQTSRRVAQVVKAANRLDARPHLGRPPMAAAPRRRPAHCRRATYSGLE